MLARFHKREGEIDLMELLDIKELLQKEGKVISNLNRAKSLNADQ